MIDAPVNHRILRSRCGDGERSISKRINAKGGNHGRTLRNRAIDKAWIRRRHARIRSDIERITARERCVRDREVHDHAVIKRYGH